MKIFAIDLDETLYNDYHEIGEENLRALNNAVNDNIKIVIASGRTPCIIDNVLNKIGIDNKNNEYSIMANGSLVIANNGEIIDVHPIEFNIVKQLFDYAYDKDVCVQIFTDKHLYFYNCIEEEELEMIKLFPDGISLRNKKDGIDELKGENIIKVMYEKRDFDYLKEISIGLKDICANQIEISFSSNRYVELNKIGINKGLGLLNLADALNIPYENTYAIGDNFNDIELIKLSGTGFAVNNACDELKKVADIILDENNNQNAVAAALKFIRR